MSIASQILAALLLAGAAWSADLIDGLGQTEPTFGNPYRTTGDPPVPRRSTENTSGPVTGAVYGFSVTDVFPAGLHFGGSNRTRIIVNENGNITFDTPDPTPLSSGIGADAAQAMIAPFLGDVDIRNAATLRSSGGRSQGTNFIYYYVNQLDKTVTVTWDDVRYNGGATPNAFQTRLIKVGDVGEFDLEFRYEFMSWSRNDSWTLTARAGYTAGNGVDAHELTEAGDDRLMRSLHLRSNLVPPIPGVFRFPMRRPRATVTPALGTRVSTNPMIFTVTFDMPTHGLDVADVTATANDPSLPLTVSYVHRISSNAYHVAVDVTDLGTPEARGVSISVVENAGFAERSGNGSRPFTHTLACDRQRPSLALSVEGGATINSTAVSFLATPNEALAGIPRDAVIPSNGTVRSVSAVAGADGISNYRIIVDTAQDGPLDLRVASNLVTDVAGNLLAADVVASATVNTVGPTTSVTTSASVFRTAPIPVTITFGQAVDGFTLADVQVGNGSAAAFAPGAGNSYSVQVTPSGDGPVSVLVAAGSASASTTGLPNSSGSRTVVYDTTPPTVAISMPNGPLGTSGGTAFLAFSEDVVNVAASISASNATLGAPVLVPGSSRTYAVGLSAVSGNPVGITVGTGVQDVAGNAMAVPVGANVVADTGLAPLVITSTATAVPVGSGPITFTFTFSGGDPDVSPGDFLATDVTVANGVRGTLVHSGPGVFSMDVQPGQGAVTASVASGACTIGAVANAAAACTAYADSQGPTASFSVEPASAQPGQTVTVTIRFSEGILALAAGDLEVVGGRVLGPLSGSGSTWQATVVCNGRPTVFSRLTVPAGVATDAAGNANQAASAIIAGSEPLRDPAEPGASDCATGGGLALLLPFLLGLLHYRSNRGRRDR